MGWQDTERGHTGMATVMYEVEAGRSVLKEVLIGTARGCVGNKQEFNKKEQMIRKT